jgi:hypothetical protein
MKRLIILSVAVLIPTAVVAKGECDGDMEKFCPGIQARDKVTACMAQHTAELSPACRAAQEARAGGPGSPGKKQKEP